MQFSITPWHYDAETTALCLKATELHAVYAPMISELAHASTTSGWPIIRPLFWVDPTDLTAAAIGHEFMLGADVLVAPVMEKGCVTPAGCCAALCRFEFNVSVAQVLHRARPTSCAC